MWKAAAGRDVKATVQANEDDDWETDPDFVVRKICYIYHLSISS